MGLSDRLARTATARVHVLVVEAPGGFEVRTTLERELSARGWVAASSPADADLLAVCGPVSDELRPHLDAVHAQVPGPRARLEVTRVDAVADALDAARDELRDDAAQRGDAADRLADVREGGDDAHEDSHEDSDMDHGDMDHGDMDHGDMDHGDMEMAPSGIPLAEGAEDRDGLEMDVLHLPLGPVLPHWPPGLVVRCTLAGDVVTGVEVELVAGPEPAPDARDTVGAAARRLDAAASLLTLSGPDDAAVLARRARDAVLTGQADARHRVARLRRRLDRAVLLRWMLRGIAPLDDADGRGDAWDRLCRLVGDADVLLAEELAGEDAAAGAAAYDPRTLLPDLLTGLELASVRLAVASVAAHLQPAGVLARG